MSGVSNKAADATSRHPSQYPTTNFSSIIDEEENSLSAAISRDVTDATSISLHDISSASDPLISKIIAWTEDGFSTIIIKSLDSPFKPFWCLCESLHVVDGDGLMYGDQVVIPQSLRECALKVLHSAHQGISGMEARAQAYIDLFI